jgi:hypothetical protein
MGLIDRLKAREQFAPAFPLAAPRCARCGELIHLTVLSVGWQGPYYHASCAPSARPTTEEQP